MNLIIPEAILTNDLKQALTGFHIDAGDFSAAANIILNFVPSSADEADWKTISTLLLNLYQGGGNLFDLGESEILQIRDIAYQADVDGSTGLARAILLLLFHEEVTNGEEPLRAEEPASPDNDLAFGANTLVGDFINENRPNPFSDFTEIEYRLPIGITSAFLKIIDITGKTLATYSINGNKGKVQVSATDFKPGVYFYSLVSENAILRSRKMVIIKE